MKFRTVSSSYRIPPCHEGGPDTWSSRVDVTLRNKWSGLFAGLRRVRSFDYPDGRHFPATFSGVTFIKKSKKRSGFHWFRRLIPGSGLCHFAHVADRNALNHLGPKSGMFSGSCFSIEAVAAPRSSHSKANIWSCQICRTSRHFKGREWKTFPYFSNKWIVENCFSMQFYERTSSWIKQQQQLQNFFLLVYFSYFSLKYQVFLNFFFPQSCP